MTLSDGPAPHAGQTPRVYCRPVPLNIFDPLVTLRSDGKQVLPALADSWRYIDPLN